MRRWQKLALSDALGLLLISCGERRSHAFLIHVSLHANLQERTRRVIEPHTIFIGVEHPKPRAGGNASRDLRALEIDLEELGLTRGHL
jgi:hypothetical protein